MKNNAFAILTIAIVLAVISGAVIFGKDTTERIRLGNEKPDNGRDHVSQAEAPKDGSDDPKTSGAHGDPVPKQAYTTELPDYNTIHNLEHGYVYITYKPDLASEEIEKIKNLFFDPYSNEGFVPTKVIMAPRASNTAPIVFSSWRRNLSFDTFNEEQMIDYYKSNVSQSPEPTAS